MPNGCMPASPRNLEAGAMLVSTVMIKNELFSPSLMGLIFSQCAGISWISSQSLNLNDGAILAWKQQFGYILGVFLSIIFSFILPFYETRYSMSFLEVCFTVFLQLPHTTNEPRFAVSASILLTVSLNSFILSNLINLSKSLQLTPSTFSELLKNLVVMSGGFPYKFFYT